MGKGRTVESSELLQNWNEANRVKAGRNESSTSLY